MSATLAHFERQLVDVVEVDRATGAMLRGGSMLRGGTITSVSEEMKAAAETLEKYYGELLEAVASTRSRQEAATGVRLVPSGSSFFSARTPDPVCLRKVLRLLGKTRQGTLTPAEADALLSTMNAIEFGRSAQ